ncbi:MAG: class F sortase [Chloroflexi bacterium]|nr:class F sortase [Chloroflexota bacterium]
MPAVLFHWFAPRLAAVSCALAVAAVVVIALVAGVAAGPTVPTADRYAGLREHQAVRADVRAEPPAPPVGAMVRATATPVRPPAAVDRLLIPRIGVDAPLASMNITLAGALDVPSDPRTVAWYDFTGRPGAPGNAVFSGHLDWKDYGPAVFWRLKDLVPGDVIEVVLKDGSTVAYTVASAKSYPVAEVPMAEVVAQTVSRSATFITCGGSFSAGEYSHRLVVRAEATH